MKVEDLNKKGQSLLFLHRKDKDYIRVTMQSDTGNSIQFTVTESNDGINDKFPVEGNSVVDLMPLSTNNIISDSLNVTKYFRENGYELCDTIGMNKSGEIIIK